MVNRQDALYSPGSSEICYFQLYSISQNCARRRPPVAADG
jgi:hypothetical protein